MCEGCPIESGMTTERSEIPDQVGDDNPSGMTIRRASEWIIFVFSSLCGGE